MSSVNKVILIGNLGRDPEVRYTPNGMAVCQISLATTRSWKDKQSGERHEETEWHRVVTYDKQAENAGQYLKKGRSVYVEGRLKTRKWTDKDGVEKYTTEVVSEDIKYLGKSESEDGQQGNQQRQQRQQRAPASQPPKRQAEPATGTGFDDMDDDIPW